MHCTHDFVEKLSKTGLWDDPAIKWVIPLSIGIRASGIALFEKSKFGECKETRIAETDKIAAYRDIVKVIAELQSPIGGKEF